LIKENKQNAEINFGNIYRLSYACTHTLHMRDGTSDD
jgi:hypothetical protein